LKTYLWQVGVPLALFVEIFFLATCRSPILTKIAPIVS
jgi:hypothetical protein